MPINPDNLGDANEITAWPTGASEAQQVQEVTVDGEVFWTAEADYDVLDNFESYDTNDDLRAAYDYGINPDRFELETSNPIDGEQSVVSTNDDTPDATSQNIQTPWGWTYVAYVRIANGDSAPGIHLHVQNDDPKGYGYWIRLNARDGQFQGYTRAGGGHDETLFDVSQSFSTGLYRIEVDLGDNNDITARVYDEDADPDTALQTQGPTSPSTVHTGGYIGLAGGFTAGDVWDDLIQSPESLAN